MNDKLNVMKQESKVKESKKTENQLAKVNKMNQDKKVIWRYIQNGTEKFLTTETTSTSQKSLLN